MTDARLSGLRNFRRPPPLVSLLSFLAREFGSVSIKAITRTHHARTHAQALRTVHVRRYSTSVVTSEIPRRNQGRKIVPDGVHRHHRQALCVCARHARSAGNIKVKRSTRRASCLFFFRTFARDRGRTPCLQQCPCWCARAPHQRTQKPK